MRISSLFVLTVVAAGGAGAAGCASTGAVPQPFPTPDRRPPVTAAPKPVATSGRGAEAPRSGSLPADGYAITATALALRGTPYKNGGADPRGFDCSGFVEYVFAQHGIAVPRTVSDLYEAGEAVDAAELQPGDLLFFSTTAPGPTHVGMAIGGDEFVHAPSTSGVVRVERLGAGYWGRRLIAVRRLTTVD